MNARKHFRVEYPLQERPVFHAAGLVCTVADVSESGMTIVAPSGAASAPKLADRIAGTIHFRHAAPLLVEGVVLRVTARGAVLKFEAAGVPWASIQREERALLAKYPR